MICHRLFGDEFITFLPDLRNERIVLNHRVVDAEIMDQNGLDEESHRQALAGLRRVNSISRSANILWKKLQEVMRERKLSALSVLDLACGGGDIVHRLAKTASSQRVSMTFHGWDKSATAVAIANSTAQHAEIGNAEFFTRDVFAESNGERYDVVMCTLFLHHLKRNDALQFLQRMKNLSTYAILDDDLHRSRIGYWMAYCGCRILSRSSIVHFDGPASVKAAFTVEEASQLADEAGLSGARFVRHWPQRFLMHWKKP